MRPASEALRAALREHDPSEEQWRAITAPLAPLAIVAGAGTGKTAVMAARIVWLVEEGLVRPSEVLGLTFTNKAAGELEDRLSLALGRMQPHPHEHPTVTTYHAFADQVVREHGPRIGIDAEAGLLSEAQKWQMLLGFVDELHTFDALEVRHPLSFIPQTLGLSDQCANHLVSPEELAAECERLLPDLNDDYATTATRKRIDFSRIVRRYTDEKRRTGRLDYGDQIVLAVDALTRFPDVAGLMRELYRVMLLDEYQDTNPAQKQLLQLICPPGSAVTAVGDARQAIYAWRGASMYNLLGFRDDFPNADGTAAAELDLSENYRSGRRIVEVANAVIARVPAERRRGKELSAHPSCGEGHVESSLYSDQETEATAVADEVESLHRDGTPWREIAILVRKHRYMDAIVAELEARDIPIEIPELGGLLKVPPVVDTVSWMRVLSDPGPQTNRWLARICMGPRFRIHYSDLAPIAKWASARNAELTKEAAELLGADEPDPGSVAYSLLEALDHADEIDGVSDEARERIGEVRALVGALRPHAGRPLLELAQTVIDATGIGETLAASASRSAPAMAQSLQSFLGVCSAFSPLRGEATLNAFLEYLDAAEQSEDAIALASTAPSDSVKVMTVHGAKGLEFDAVFLPALAASPDVGWDGRRKGSVFPDIRSSDPLSSTMLLPPGVRRDAEHLPRLEAGMPKAAYRRALRDRAEEDERRLLYVAITRARRRLYCSGAYWYGTEDRKGPSEFLDEIRAMAPLVTAGPWADPPEGNPVVAAMRERLRWPVERPRLDDDVLEWIHRVDALVAGTMQPSDVLAESPAAQALYREHVALVDTLDDDVQTRPAGARPASLAATAAVRIALGREPAAAVLVPLPERPTEARRLGVEVHAWIEERSKGLVGLADQDALDEASLTPDPETVRRMRENYVRLGYDGRTLARLDSGEAMSELPFTLKVADRLVRGRIDAVYEGGPGEPSHEVVDFKTGVVPDDPDWGQLELYAEALAALGVVAGEVTLTYADLREGRPVSKRYTPAGLDQLASGLRTALPS